MGKFKEVLTNIGGFDKLYQNICAAFIVGFCILALGSFILLVLIILSKYITLKGLFMILLTVGMSFIVGYLTFLIMYSKKDKKEKRKEWAKTHILHGINMRVYYKSTDNKKVRIDGVSELYAKEDFFGIRQKGCNITYIAFDSVLGINDETI